MKKIMVVDDDLIAIRRMSDLLSANYHLLLAKSGAQALQICAAKIPDLILLDVNMPEMDGFAAIGEIRRLPGLYDTPVIFLTATNDPAVEVKALESGAVDFITKPAEKSVLMHRIELHLQFTQYRTNLERTVRELEDNLVASFSEIIECRDQNTGGHVVRTGKYLEILGTRLKRENVFPGELGDEELAMMVRAAALHDIGKIGISDAVLRKPGKLDPDEFEVMKKHTLIGAEMLQTMHQRTPTQRYLRYAKTIAEGHHEKYAGGGYPHGLHGDDIPLCSRIMAVVDVYDALVEDRVYRKAMSHEEACRIIHDGSGCHFDHRIVAVFETCGDLFRQVGR